MKNKLRSIFLRAVAFANEARETIETLFMANAFTPAAENWVQLSPFGDFGNKDAKGARVIQRFRKEDAEHICNEFNGLGRKITQPLGMPFYVGHPDHAKFKGQPGHTDTAAKGRGKEFAVRHDAGCAKCSSFANAKDAKEAAPCGDHGLFVKMNWNHEGEELIGNEAFHGHSVNWSAVPDGAENGVKIFRPVRVKSCGFTNEPNIPVTPAQLANEDAGEEAAETPAEKVKEATTIVHPKLKLIAGFAATDDCSMDEVIAALEKIKAGPSGLANSAEETAKDKPITFLVAPKGDGTLDVQLANDGGVALADLAANVNGYLTAALAATAAVETSLANEKTGRIQAETAFANERKARATLVVGAAVKAGSVILAEKEARIEELCNAGDAFDAKAAALANSTPVIKTAAKTGGLAGKHAVIENDVRTRQQKFESLMAKREQELPNELYQDRFEAVANSDEGKVLFTQMVRAGADEDAKD